MNASKKETFADGAKFTHDGREFSVSIKHDADSGAPWEDADGHGVVTDWQELLSNDEAEEAGLRVLGSDRNRARYYDFNASLELAKKDNWCSAGDDAMAIQRAVEADYEYLRRWCNDDWTYVGVVVTLLDGKDAGESESLWGIESDAYEYLAETARELAGELLHRAVTAA